MLFPYRFIFSCKGKGTDNFKKIFPVIFAVLISIHTFCHVIPLCCAYSADVTSIAEEQLDMPVIYIDTLVNKIDAKHESALHGDVSNDGEFNISDIVIFQKWLPGASNTELANWKAADLCADDRLDIFDLYLMRRMLIKL